MVQQSHAGALGKDFTAKGGGCLKGGGLGDGRWEMGDGRWGLIADGHGFDTESVFLFSARRSWVALLFNAPP
jgi:hypothetical protein